MTMLRAAFVITCVALSGVSSGCGYALVGRGNALPASIKTIGIPQFGNESTVGEVAPALTKAVVTEFQSRGRYRIDSETAGVDAVFTGTVMSVTLTPLAFTTDNQVARNQVVITARLEFKDTATNKVIWSNAAFQLRDEYLVTTSDTANDPAALFSQDENALERISRSFSKSVVTAIFEAF
jgi:hypothetical protein